MSFVLGAELPKVPSRGAVLVQSCNRYYVDEGVQLRSAAGKAFAQAEIVVDTFGERSKAGKSFDADERWICRATLCWSWQFQLTQLSLTSERFLA